MQSPDFYPNPETDASFSPLENAEMTRIAILETGHPPEHLRDAFAVSPESIYVDLQGKLCQYVCSLSAYQATVLLRSSLMPVVGFHPRSFSIFSTDGRRFCISSYVLP